MQALALTAITLDPDLQPRARIDDETWQDYAEALAAQVELPAVTVFFDGATNWLADGYHRWHAHKAIGAEEIDADVRQGSKQEALRFSLSANATHGRRRGQADYQKAYDIACRNGLVPAHDATDVQALLQCSLRWARELTKEARDAADRKREDAIRAEKATGASNRQVGERLGISRKTVDRTVGPKGKSAEMAQPEPTSEQESSVSQRDVQPYGAHKRHSADREQWGGETPPHPAAPNPGPAATSPERLPGLAALDEAGVRHWTLALEAMRAINDLPTIAAMFEHPDWRQQEAIEAEIARAAAWLNTFHTRFEHDRPAR